MPGPPLIGPRCARPALALVSALALALAAQYCFTGELLTHNLESHTADLAPRVAVGVVLLGLAVAVSASTPATDRAGVDARESPGTASLLLAIAVASAGALAMPISTVGAAQIAASHRPA